MTLSPENGGREPGQFIQLGPEVCHEEIGPQTLLMGDGGPLMNGPFCPHPAEKTVGPDGRPAYRVCGLKYFRKGDLKSTVFTQDGDCYKHSPIERPELTVLDE
jgi:hypothetical protein